MRRIVCQIKEKRTIPLICNEFTGMPCQSIGQIFIAILFGSPCAVGLAAAKVAIGHAPVHARLIWPVIPFPDHHIVGHVKEMFCRQRIPSRIIQIPFPYDSSRVACIPQRLRQKRMTLRWPYCAHIRIPIDSDPARLHTGKQTNPAGTADWADRITLGKA